MGIRIELINYIIHTLKAKVLNFEGTLNGNVSWKARLIVID